GRGPGRRGRPPLATPVRLMGQHLLAAGHRATFSPCRRYRYALQRRWADGPAVCWVMLNPSSADEHRDDPTIRRCVGFSQSWGYAGLVAVNLFASRTPDPAALWSVADPVGPGNDAAIRGAAAGASLVVAAWGDQARLPFRARCRVVERLLAAA